VSRLPRRRHLQVFNRDGVQKGLRLGCRVVLGVSIRDHEPVQPHQRIDRRIHRLEVAIEHLGDLPPDTHFCPAAVIGGHDPPEAFSRRIGLAFEQRLDAPSV
jgi:hypothetical protein